MGISNRLAGDICSCPSGKRNLITDVPGISVGHATIREGGIHTGVTAIIPHPDNTFRDKLAAAVHVINGFGKSLGLMQIDELGTLETPILITNTFAVGTGSNALTKYMLARNADIGDTTGTVNPVVLECNDGAINDIRAMAVTEDDVMRALDRAADSFDEGAVGAGTGMCCYGLKGGVGSASRVIGIDGQDFTLGALVVTNFGFMRDLTVDGYPVGAELAAARERDERGSIIVVLATDIPLSDRQLRRMSKRASVGISRTGAFIGNGSGEVVVSFSTANRIAHYPDALLHEVRAFSETGMNDVFRAAVSAVEEAILSSLAHAETTAFRSGEPCLSLRDAVMRAKTDENAADMDSILARLVSP